MADSDDKPESEPTLLERWLADQQEWQRTAMAYLDSMAKNDDFLVHLGNAMRGSLLAGKPYPAAAPLGAAAEAPADDRLDRVLFELHQIQGQLADLRLSIDELRARQPRTAGASGGASPARRSVREGGAPTKTKTKTNGTKRAATRARTRSQSPKRGDRD